MRGGLAHLPLVAIILVGLAGCQTDALKPTEADKAAAGGAAATAVAAGNTGLYNQTLGAGPVRIGYLGVRRNDQPSRQADSEYRDGAALAVNSLGTEKVKLTMLETQEKPEAIEAAAKSLASQNIGLLITTARGPEFEAIKRSFGDRQIPVISFQMNDATLPPDVFSFVSSPVDGLVEGASFAMAEGSTHAVILASSPAEKIEAERIARQIKAFGGTVEPIIELSGGQVPSKQLAAWILRCRICKQIHS